MPMAPPRRTIGIDDAGVDAYGAGVRDVDVPGADAFGTDDSGATDIINVRIGDPAEVSILRSQKGILPAYHMAAKDKWISVRLDGTVRLEEIENLIGQSFDGTAGNNSAARGSAGAARGPKNWLIPAAVAYADPMHFWDDGDVITWTQSSRVQPGDLVFIYAGVPIGAILYRTRAIETDLPAGERMREDFASGKMMRLELEKSYGTEKFSRTYLTEQYGIRAVRGPRYVPDKLFRELMKDG